MELPITPQQRDALHAHPGQPVPLVDTLSSEKYFLVPAPAFLHLQALASEAEHECNDQLRTFIQQGLESKGVPADQAFARLKQFAQQLLDARK
jgi:hypothetical protein